MCIFWYNLCPNYSPSQIVRIIKSITAKEIFKQVPSVKKELWGGKFWSSGFYIGTVGQNVSEGQIQNYVKQQGQSNNYKQLHFQQLGFVVEP